MSRQHDGGTGGTDAHSAGGSDHQTHQGGSEGHDTAMHEAARHAYTPRTQGHPSATDHGGGTTHPTESGTTHPTEGGTTHPTEGGTTHPTEGGTTHPTEGGDHPPPTEGGGNPPPTEGGGNPPPREDHPHRNNNRRHGGYGGGLPELIIVPFVRIEADNGNESIIRGQNGATANGRDGMTFP